MKWIGALAGVIVLGLLLTGRTVPVSAQSSKASGAVVENPAPEPTLDPLPLPSTPEPDARTPEAILGVQAPGSVFPRVPNRTGAKVLGLQEPGVALEWIGPPQIRVGRPADYSVVVRNGCNTTVQQVLVRVQLPHGVRVTETEPKANAEHDVLWWDLGTLRGQEKKELLVRLVPDGEGTVACQAWVTFTGASVVRLTVSEPKLALKVTPPPKVLFGDPVPFVFTVSNPGDTLVEHITIHATLSEGLEGPGGQSVDIDGGNLAPGESRSVQLVCAAKAGGEQKCEVVAQAQGDLRAKDRARVSIEVPRLDVEVSGPKLRYLDRKAVYSIKVTNPGDGPANHVVLSDVVPAGFQFNAASDGGRSDPATRTVSWFLGDVGPGQSKEVKLEVLAVTAGEHQHHVSAQGARGIKADVNLATRVEGMPALLLEVTTTERSIEVGADTSYEIRITNTGTKEETDLKLTGILPEALQLKSATGPSRFQARGNEIVFEPLPRLAPRGDAVYRINVKAVSAGDVRFKAQLSSANLSEPMVQMESTRIYQD
jgi:uncharacterized repeat protein (TIGR01451 family)